MTKALLEIYDKLLDTFGPQHWWPGESRLEIIVGAILTQNTNWKNVEKAIRNMKREKVLKMGVLMEMNQKYLAGLLRPSGYFNQKAKKIKAFVSHVFSIHNGSLKRMGLVDLDPLRRELLGIFGIGPETADSILLYAYQKPVFVVDTYTKRIFSRHGFFNESWSYDEMQSFFMRHLPRDIALYNEYHALIVRTGNGFCRKNPICNTCPLEVYL